MQNFFTKTKTYIATHKKTSIFIAIVILIVAYFIYTKATATTGETTYTLGTVQTGTIVSSITGSGQVSAGRTLDLKPQASANVTYVPVVAGQTVTQGQLIAELDDTTAQKAVRDAQASLESAQISLEKEQEPATSLTLLQAQDAVTQANSDLTQSYQDGFNDVSSTFLDLPGIITGVDGALHNTDVNTSTNNQQNIDFYQNAASQYENAATDGKAAGYASDAQAKYQAALAAYNKTFADYKATDRTADTATLQGLIDETYQTSELVADAVKSTNNLIQYYQDTINAQSQTPAAKSTTYLSSIAGYTGKINADVSTLLDAKTTITNDISNIPEKQASLEQVTTGADPLDLQSAQLAVTRAQNSLQDAKDTLADYSVTAPFSGTLASVDVNVGDPASSDTAVATLITSDQVVDIPLNEVDVSKVQLGDKATLTFDAIDDLTLTGKVASIDTVGTVTQGVVNYTVTIAFDSTDPRVKPGMSTTASIITEVHSDVLTVPSSAVKTNAAGSYVLAFPAGTTTADQTSIISETAPEQIPVTVGISDDTNTEIDSGLTADQQIVTKSVVATVAKTATTAASATSLLGGGATGRTTGAARGGASAFGAARGG